MEVVSELSALLKEKEAQVVRLQQILESERRAHKTTKASLKRAKALASRYESSACSVVLELEESRCQQDSLKRALLHEKKKRLKCVLESQRELDRERCSKAILRGELDQVVEQLQSLVDRARVLESADSIVQAAQYRSVQLYERCCRLQQQLYDHDRAAPATGNINAVEP